jgi:hypothetical protein
MMKRLLLATAMLATMAVAGTASAQSPFDLERDRLRLIGRKA